MTSEPKFTPGPWRVLNETSVGNGKCRVADCENIEVGFGGCADEYNAALIAAAPEMYELLDEIQRPGGTFSLQQIRNILKKARGEK